MIGSRFLVCSRLRIAQALDVFRWISYQLSKSRVQNCIRNSSSGQGMEGGSRFCRGGRATAMLKERLSRSFVLRIMWKGNAAAQIGAVETKGQ